MFQVSIELIAVPLIRSKCWESNFAEEIFNFEIFVEMKTLKINKMETPYHTTDTLHKWHFMYERWVLLHFHTSKYVTGNGIHSLSHTHAQAHIRWSWNWKPTQRRHRSLDEFLVSVCVCVYVNDCVCVFSGEKSRKNVYMRFIRVLFVIQLRCIIISLRLRIK